MFAPSCHSDHSVRRASRCTVQMMAAQHVNRSQRLPTRCQADPIESSRMSRRAWSQPRCTSTLTVQEV